MYIVGGITGPVDCDPGSGTYVLDSGSYSTGCILKLDSALGFQWADAELSAAGSSGSYPYALSLGASSLMIAGEFQGTVDFNPSGGDPRTALANDAFVSRLGTDGSY